jgi:uncharacterized protein YodC (DUF2158 family)
MALKVGDTVRLKSGGPLMTVTILGERDGSPMVECAWFEKTESKTAEFPPDSLEVSQKPSAARVAARLAR